MSYRQWSLKYSIEVETTKDIFLFSRKTSYFARIKLPMFLTIQPRSKIKGKNSNAVRYLLWISITLDSESPIWIIVTFMICLGFLMQDRRCWIVDAGSMQFLENPMIPFWKKVYPKWWHTMIELKLDRQRYFFIKTDIRVVMYFPSHQWYDII